MSFGILIALDFNEDKFMFVFFRCIMIKGSEQTSKLEDNNLRLELCDYSSACTTNQTRMADNHAKLSLRSQPNMVKTIKH
jgi:hypothetical protein